MISPDIVLALYRSYVLTHAVRQSYAIQTDMHRISYAFYVGFKAE